MIPGSANPLLLKSAAAAGGYQIERSLRFNSADSAYLSRTPAVAGDRKKWTWAAWAKRSSTVNSKLFYIQTGSAQGGIEWTNTAQIGYFNAPTNYSIVKTTGVFRDFSAWYHIVVVLDAANTSLKIYVNGVEQALTVAAPIINENHNINNTVEHNIGKEPTASEYFNGYLADIHFIDGQALTPAAFTEVSATTGQLIPKAYAGTYTGNSFWLKFNDNSAATATTLGKDSFLLGNNWTPNNLSVTAGAGNDSLVDTPTSYGTDTGVGGEVRGNYATLNPLDTNTAQITLQNGNLDCNQSGADSTTRGTIGVSSGKWYWEATLGNTKANVGIARASATLTNYLGSDSNGWSYYSVTGQKINSGSFTSYGATATTGDVIGIAFDADNGTLAFYINGASQGTAFTGLTSGPYFPAQGTSGSLQYFNFGQRAFAYQTPGTNRPAATFLALCDTNLGPPLVALPNTVMDVKLYDGNSGTQSITGLAFSPDWVWIKTRSQANNNFLFDAVRGATKYLVSDLTIAEQTVANTLTSFDSGGFTTGSNNDTNASGRTFVAWMWDAGTTTASNTQGSITSQVRANVSAGFSIVTYTGNSVQGATVGHGLGVVPSMVIYKGRVGSLDWLVYHASLGATQGIYLNQTLGATTSANFFNNTAPNSSTLYLNSSPPAGQTNETGYTYVAYCFAPVVGYSSMGSYVGNYSADGPFVYTGFRPRWLLIKCSSTSGFDWRIFDTSRSDANGANVVNYKLYPNSSAQENDPSLDNQNSNSVDILSNGFKLRTANGATNDPNTYIYAAFAENPFQYARAR